MSSKSPFHKFDLWKSTNLVTKVFKTFSSSTQDINQLCTSPNNVLHTIVAKDLKLPNNIVVSSFFFILTVLSEIAYVES